MAFLFYRHGRGLVVVLRANVLGLLALFFSACANPLASIQSDINTFKEKYPNHFGHLALGDRKIHYAWSGDTSKRPLIFVHGSPGSWQGWAHYLLDENLQKNFFLLALDRLGYGGSGQGLSEPSLQDQARSVLALTTLSKATAKPILVGHSFGGAVIASAAMLSPSAISGLLFLASSVAPELEKTKWFQYPATWWPIRLLIPTDLRVCNEEILPLKQQLEAHEQQWSRVLAKVAVLHGTDDRLVPVGNADYLVSKIKKEFLVSLVRIENQGHFIPWERSDLVYRAIYALDAAISTE